MSFIPCSFCGKRNVGKLNHVYWFAPNREGEVFRVRQRLCEDCLAVNVGALLTPEDQELLTCSACGISVEDDVYPVYLTWYPEHKLAVRGAMALCEEHQLEIKVRASQGALELPDRYVEAPDRVVAAPTPALEAFRAVGRLDPGVKHRPPDTRYRPSIGQPSS